MSKVIGIDLGTTYSAVAYVNRDGRPEIIPNREGERITPSVVMFDEAGKPVVGRTAKNLAAMNPKDFVQLVKRHMGDPSWKFRTQGRKEYTPEELSAMILTRLKEDAEAALGEAVRDAVITVPAYFDDAQRKATQDAGRIAGLNVLRIINEPTAAALVYGLDRLNEPQTVLVYDLGGGTFDVTIMRIAGDIQVKATGGNRNLGGTDWDDAIMRYLNAEFRRAGGPNLLDGAILEHDLREKSEAAKKTLSSMLEAKVFPSADGKTIPVRLTRAMLEEVTANLLEKTASILAIVLKDANLGWSQIDKVLLVGGSTRMPAVAALVAQLSGKKPSMELHADEVVALGAAIQGTLLAVQQGKADLVERDAFPLVEITDVNSHSLGVIAQDRVTKRDRNHIILPKDTPIPTRQAQEFCTTYDNQEEVLVQLTEGEDEDPKYITIVGTATMKIPGRYPQGSPISIVVSYDEDGLIVCQVYDGTSKKHMGNVEFVRKNNRTEAEVREMQKKFRSLTVG